MSKSTARVISSQTTGDFNQLWLFPEITTDDSVQRNLFSGVPDRPGRNGGMLLSGNPASTRKPLPDGTGVEQTPQEHAEDVAIFAAKTWEQSVAKSLESWADERTKHGANKVLRYLIKCAGWYPDRPDYLRCLVRISTICDATGLSKRAVIKILGILERRGLIKRRRRKVQREDGTWRQRSNSYLLCPGQVLTSTEPKTAFTEKVHPGDYGKSAPVDQSTFSDQNAEVERCNPSSTEAATSTKTESLVQRNDRTYKKLTEKQKRVVRQIRDRFLENTVDSRQCSGRRINWDDRPGARYEAWTMKIILRDPIRAYEELVDRMATIPQGIKRRPYRGMVIGVLSRLNKLYKMDDVVIQRTYVTDPDDPVRSMDREAVQSVIRDQLAIT